MWAGGKLTLLHPLKVGASIKRHSLVADIQFKQGKSGDLCFVTLTHDTYCDGLLAIQETQDVVYKGASNQPILTQAQDNGGTLYKSISFSPALLFRYSALTFNTHRIHYDREYAMQQEGYHGLVVHGPLQATHLMHAAQDLRDGALKTFTFRGLTPLYDGQQATLRYQETLEGLKLWFENPLGHITMQALAA